MIKHNKQLQEQICLVFIKKNIIKEYSNTIDIGCDRLFAQFRGFLVHFVVWSSSLGNARAAYMCRPLRWKLTDAIYS